MSAQERGLARLMLRFPKLRERLAQMRDIRLHTLCEEYDLVWEALMQASQSGRCAMFSAEDYRLLVSSIESDAVSIIETGRFPASIGSQGA